MLGDNQKFGKCTSTHITVAHGRIPPSPPSHCCARPLSVPPHLHLHLPSTLQGTLCGMKWRNLKGEGERGERGERGKGGERGEEGDRGKGGENGERGERGERRGRGERRERGERGERWERRGRGGRGGRGGEGERGVCGENTDER